MDCLMGIRIPVTQVPFQGDLKFYEPWKPSHSSALELFVLFSSSAFPENSSINFNEHVRNSTGG